MVPVLHLLQLFTAYSDTACFTLEIIKFIIIKQENNEWRIVKD